MADTQDKPKGDVQASIGAAGAVTADKLDPATKVDASKAEDGDPTKPLEKSKEQAAADEKRAELEKPKVKTMSASEALLVKDGEKTPGKVVKDGQLVRVLVSDSMTDSLTCVTYTRENWKEAKASAWLDGQLKAQKIEVKG